ncbi:HD domain-containing phosphohydrolase [uncultured Desulfobulbus sp.]|uniref:HD domain-containing phosphohydrolase n=1 Tax=uncultured Desulfobulbus sp. TaxID=239745 RepID=UPI0029C83361|nr:HD domain-containing phosphohydrolase [uncultured Desulfobulbus sp.]
MEKAIVLIVDDEPINIEVLDGLLNSFYSVRACKSGEQVLGAMNRAPLPDLILMDVMMPGMDGYSVLKQLRQNMKTAEIPVMFITARGEEHDEEYGLRLGAVDYITKPIKPAVVLSRVQAHLEVKKSRDRLKDQNAWLETEVQKRMTDNQLIQDVSLTAMAQLAETRDSDLGNHIARTQAYVEALARQLQTHPVYGLELSKVMLNRIVKASPLHDIGKIGIPDHILLKPGKFTAEEWAVMQTHCRIGGNALARAMETTLSRHPANSTAIKPEALTFLEVARDIAYCHHEKWDGTGYPEGIAGTTIPLAARLMAVADVFDALTTPRVYKEPWPTEKAVNLIHSQQGTHFDPVVVEAFAAVLDDFLKIQKRLEDPPLQEQQA